MGEGGREGLIGRCVERRRKGGREGGREGETAGMTFEVEGQAGADETRCAREK